ncbi:hypothetical protein B1A99_27040 [Cohnella sp. CIP 111063]|uniref:DUF1801 domain-containing protein n=1 Tax=unclassified Cohnella TaxID=2636738 RepID=UPI000B8C640C|nr:MULTISPECIES: DUF1801 domain-containing protein [unclassified Cohnella]OXS54248.1 hypothetical protein B1A99_27040 [Cohnella sp. CIP 111063]PRX63437.1 hypothetical protein B0G52_12161 [Cohnella sp. SGD-V74]
MNPEVTDFIESLKEPWQVELSTALRAIVHEAVDGVQERIQYKKPHFLKNGKYAAVISPSKEAVSFTLFNASGLELPEDRFEGPPERKTLKLRKGQAPDSAELISLLRQAASTL